MKIQFIKSISEVLYHVPIYLVVVVTLSAIGIILTVINHKEKLICFIFGHASPIKDVKIIREIRSTFKIKSNYNLEGSHCLRCNQYLLLYYKRTRAIHYKNIVIRGNKIQKGNYGIRII